MAFPTISGVTQTDNTSNVTTHNVTLPATITAGQLIVVLGSWDSTGTPTTMTKDDSTAGTWTELYNQHVLATPSQAGGCCWVKVADGTEDGATLQPTTNETQQSHWFSFVVSNWHGTIATGTDSATTTGADQTTPDSPALDPGWGAVDVLMIQACHSDMSASPTISAYPETSNNNSNSGGTGSALVAFSSSDESGGTYSLTAWTISASDQCYASTIAVRPAASGNSFYYQMNQ